MGPARAWPGSAAVHGDSLPCCHLFSCAVFILPVHSTWMESQCDSLVSLSPVPFGTLASPMSEFAASCTPRSQFARALHTRSLFSPTSGTEETSCLLCSVELSDSPVPKDVGKLVEPATISAALRSLPLSPPSHRPLCRTHREWRSLRRVRSSLHPRKNRRPLAMRRQSSEPGASVEASASRGVRRTLAHSPEFFS